jgi:hypothetical protein
VTRWAAALVLVASVAGAHTFDPGLLDLRERGGGVFDIVWKSPPASGAGASGQLAPVFGASCRRVSDVAARADADGLGVFRIDCGRDGLRGRTIGVAGLSGHASDVVVRIGWADGTTTTGVLRSGSEEFAVPGTGTGAPVGTVLRRYGRLGVEHVLGGADHVAFVLGLLLLVVGWQRLVETITAFMVAHTLTLGAAVLGVVRVPRAPVEAMIAVSIVLVAVEALRPADRAPSLAQRAPWVVAFLFGLLHGLGLAGALADVGLPPDHVPAALLAFNVGVELGLLAFVGVVLLPVLWLRRRAPRWAQAVPAYAIGAVAVAWTLERVAAFWS